MFTVFSSISRFGMTGLLSLALSGFISIPVYSESLLDVYQQALVNSPDYQAAIHQRNASSETYKQSRSLLLPQVAVRYKKTKTSQDIVSSDNAVFGAGTTSFPTKEHNISVNQSIYSYANWARFSQSKAELKRIDAEFATMHQDLIFNTAEAYFTALSVNEDYQSSLAETRAVEQHYRLIEAKRSEGLARETDLLDAQARYLQSHARELEIQTQLKDALQGLIMLTGKSPASMDLLGEELDLDTPEPEGRESWLRMALEYSPEIEVGDKAVKAAWQEVKAQKGGRYPTLDFQYNLNDRNTEGTLFGGGSEVETRDVILELNLPIYTGGATSSKVREAVQLHSKAKQELASRRRDVRRKVFSGYSGVMSDIAKTEALSKSVEAYALAVAAKTLAYHSGLTNSLAVLDAERDLFFARTQYARARYDYILNTLRLKRVAGILAEEDLVHVNGWLVSDNALLFDREPELDAIFQSTDEFSKVGMVEDDQSDEGQSLEGEAESEKDEAGLVIDGLRVDGLREDEMQ